MADLSKVLGDVYATADRPDVKSATAPRQAPEWADESRLDAAFADWTPGPQSDAPAAERALFSPAVEPLEHEASGPLALDDDLAAALSEALAEAPPLADNDLFDQDDHAEPPAPAPAAVSVFVPEPAPVIAPVPVDEGTPAEPEPVPTITQAEGHALLVDSGTPASAAASHDEEALEAPTGPRPTWNRSDDDLLPRRAGRKGLSLSFLRR